MIGLLLFNNFYPVMSYEFKRKRKRRIIVYGSVARYGPRTKLLAQGVKTPRSLYQACISEHVVEYKFYDSLTVIWN